MRPLARTAFALCAAASLLLCHTACLLWARSYTASEQVVWAWGGGSRPARTEHGSDEVGLLLADWSDQRASTFGLKYMGEEARPPFNYLLLMCSSAGDVFIDHVWG